MENLDNYVKNLGFEINILHNAIEYSNSETSQTITIFKDVKDDKLKVCFENICAFSMNELKMILDKCNELK